MSDPQASEQSYQKSSHTVAKDLDSTLDFTTWGSGKGTGNPQEYDCEGQQDFITELPQAYGNRDSWKVQTKPCTHKDPGERSSHPTRV